MLVGTDHEGRNAWHKAELVGKLDVVQKTWKQAKERLTTEEIKNVILLVTDKGRQNACHIAAYGSTKCNAENVRLC